MTRKQMIGTLNSYCDKVGCSLCEFRRDDCSSFSSATDEELKRYVERIGGKIIDTEPQNVCELAGKKMEQVKVLKEVTRMIYPNRMEEVIPIKEFVKNITDKGYKVMVRRENVIGGKYDVVIYEEEELKE
ncbi:Uncharacterised protein [Anaerostipes hadrus]|uniref:Uncharacterized protein n=1 Tax=Anaerostipes hadrus TaxID=649756 RepID=A0A173TYT8_ANAHA|nr:hypothetical protein [Anaerostipes hadrus]CUN07246.1 Uncharacterised protein [Anaerostipes hadrus]